MDLTDRLACTDTILALDDAYAAAYAAIDDSLMSVCRDRVAMLLRHQPTLSTMSAEQRSALSNHSGSDRYTDLEQTALDFTEQYIIDVTALSDRQAERLRAHLGNEGLVDFVNSLLVIEQRMTLELALDRVLGEAS